MPFLFIDTGTTATTTTTTQWQPFREYEWNIETHDFILRDGRIHIVEGIPALKIWIYKTLLTQRGRYHAYTWDYGNDLETLIGSALTRSVIVSEAKRITEEALYTNQHIHNLKNFNAWMEDNTMKIEFIAVTDSGDIEVNSVV